MNTAPGGDAMIVRYHTEVPKPGDVRRPLTWLIHPDDVIRFAAEGKHCETRRCHNPVAIVTWRFWRSAEVGRVLLAEHLACVEHGQAFAARHKIEIEPVRGPADLPPTAQRLFPGDLLAEFLERGEHFEQRARLAALTAVQIEGVAASGWPCGFPHCPDPARYLSSLRYATRNGREAQRGRFLCDRHAASFATRHGIDMASVLPPEEDTR